MMIFLVTFIFSLCICYFITERGCLVGVHLPKGNRVACLDGLRGYLALMVVAHHFYITHHWLVTGVWAAPEIPLIKNLGRVGVAIFFMITGFLFVSKLANDKISGKRTNWKNLYLSRFFRIAPLYYFVVLITVVVTLANTGLTAQNGPLSLVKDIGRWLLFSGEKINDYANTKTVSAGVTWTLMYEWLFYLSLPFIAFFLRKRWLTYIMIAMCILLFLADKKMTNYVIFFLFGGLTAYLKIITNQTTTLFLQSRKVTVIAIISMIIVLLSHQDVTKSYNAILLLLFFAPVVMGNSMFTLLTRPASMIMGEISYSIYLLHGVVLYTLFTGLFPSVAKLSELAYFALMPVIFICVLFLAALSFRFIESPFISLGKRFMSQEKNKRAETGTMANLE